MSDELNEAYRSIEQRLVTNVQVASQLLQAFIQLRLVAQRRREARAAEAAEQASRAADAVAKEARAEYARDRERFKHLGDPAWWETATPEDVKEACETAMRWAPASPEAAAAARSAAEFITEYGLADELDVDVDALANARVDPAHAREFAAMQTGSSTPATRAAENDPNADIVREAFGDRADDFLWQPMWDTLSEAIDHAHRDGQYDVVSLLREGDRWRDYGPPDDPNAGERDKAGLLAWRVENFLGSTDRHPGATWKGANRMNPRPRSATIIDGEVIDRDDDAPPQQPSPEDNPPGPEAAAAPEEAPVPPVNTDHQAMAAQLADEWPEGAERLTGSRQWGRAAERLCRLRDAGVDVVPYLKGLKVKWDQIKDPAAYLAKIIDNKPPKPSPPAAEASQPKAAWAGVPRDAPQAVKESAMAAYATEHWPAEFAQQVQAAKNWPRMAERMASILEDGSEPFITVGRPRADGRLDMDSVVDLGATYVVLVDPDRPDQDPRLAGYPNGIHGAGPPSTAPAAAAAPSEPPLPRIDDRHEPIVAAMREKWPDAVDDVLRSPRWERLEATFDRLLQGGTNAVAVIENAKCTLADKKHPAAYLDAVMSGAHQDHLKRKQRPPSGPVPATRRPQAAWRVNSDGEVIPAVRSLTAAVGPIRRGRAVIALPAAPHQPGTSRKMPNKGTER